MAAGQAGRAGEVVGGGLIQLIQRLGAQRDERRREESEDALIKALDDATRPRSEPIVAAPPTSPKAAPPIAPSRAAPLGAAPVSPAPAAAPGSQLDPLEAALSVIREEEGEIETGPTGQPLPPAPGKTVRERADTAAFKSAITKEKQAQQILAQERQDQSASGISLTQAIRAASKIRAPGTEEHRSLVNDLMNISKDASLRNMAKAISTRMNAQGAATTPESILRQGAENVVNMSKTFKDLPPHTKIQIIEERGITADGNTGFRKIAVIAEGPDAGKVIGPAGNPEFVTSPVARTQDVNATGLAKRRDLVDRQLTDFVVFAQTANKVINALTPEMLSGGMVGFAEKMFGNIRSMSSLFVNQFSAEGMDIQFDPDNPPMESFAGLDFMSPRIRNLLQVNSNLRSTYAHMAILYFRASNPTARSMSPRNLKVTMAALGGSLNDPLLMKNTLRTLVQNMALRAEIEARGVDLSSRDPNGYIPGRNYDLLGGEGDPSGRYYISPETAFNLRVPTDMKVGGSLGLEGIVGAVSERFSPKKSDEEVLETMYWDTDTKMQLTTEQVLGKLKDSGFGHIGLGELAAAEFDEELAKLVKDRFSIVLGSPPDESFMPKAEVPNVGELTPETLEAMQSGGMGMDAESGVIIREVPF